MQNILLIILLSVSVISCTSTGRSTYTIDPTRRYNISDRDDQDTKEKSSVDKKIIYNAYFDIAVRDRDSANAQISKMAQSSGGYVLESGTKRTVFRVPSENLESCLSQLDIIGKVVSSRKSANDVTDEFYDSELKLDNLTKARLRYLEILQQAKTVEEVLSVEKELNRVNSEIESITGKLNRLKHLVSFSTVTIEWQDLLKLGPISYAGYYTFKLFSWLFIL